MREAGPRKKVPRRGAAGQWAFLGWGKLHGKTEPNGADQLLVPALAHHRDRFAQGVAEKHQRESRDRQLSTASAALKLRHATSWNRSPCVLLMLSTRLL